MGAIGRWYKSIALLLLTVIVLIAIAEFAAGHHLRDLRRVDRPYMLDYSDEQIRKLYDTDQPGMYREVLAEGWGVGYATAYRPFVEFDMVPRGGRHVNIADEGFRKGGGAPDSLNVSGRRIFVYGGSTTLGMGVADDETIPARLQLGLREAGFADAHVFNFGTTGWFSTQERIAFAQHLASGVVPDLAIFIDGLNDFYFCAVPDRSDWSDRIERLTEEGSRRRLVDILADRSNVVRVARHYLGEEPATPDPSGGCDKPEAVEKALRRLDANRRLIAGMAATFGVKVLFVQQPVPTFAFDNARRPIGVLPAMLGRHVASGPGYARMEALRAEGRLYDRDVLWLQRLSIPGSQYVDTVHYSPAFSAAIAAEILDVIERQGLLKQRNYVPRAPSP